MKKCNECNVEMIENADIHTDYTGGIDFETQLYLSFVNGTVTRKNLFGKEKTKNNNAVKKVKARVCPKCGKIELFVDLATNKQYTVKNIITYQIKNVSLNDSKGRQKHFNSKKKRY